MPLDSVRTFSLLYCGTIALQVSIHFADQLRFLRTSPTRLYGRPPRLLGLISLPADNELLFTASGAGFVLGLVTAASGWWYRAGLTTALICYFFYFPPIIQHQFVRRKTNLIPITLLLLLVAPGQALLLIKLLLCLAYFSAGFEKLRSGGIRWANGGSLRAWLIEHHLYSGSPSALRFAQHPLWCRFLSSAVLAWELTFWVILPAPSLAWLYVPLGLLVHTGTAITMRIHYWIYFCPVYFVFCAPWLSRYV